MLRRDSAFLMCHHHCRAWGVFIREETITICWMLVLEYWIVGHSRMTFLSLKCLAVRQAVSQPAYVRSSFILSTAKRKEEDRRSIWESDVVVAACNPIAEAGELQAQCQPWLQYQEALSQNQKPCNNSSAGSSSWGCHRLRDVRTFSRSLSSSLALLSVCLALLLLRVTLTSNRMIRNAQFCAFLEEILTRIDFVVN